MSMVCACPCRIDFARQSNPAHECAGASLQPIEATPVRLAFLAFFAANAQVLGSGLGGEVLGSEAAELGAHQNVVTGLIHIQCWPENTGRARTVPCRAARPRECARFKAPCSRSRNDRVVGEPQLV